MKLEFAIKLRAAMHYDEAAEVWVSWCPALDVRSQGTTEQRAQDAIGEALAAYVRYCYRRGILWKILEKRGFVVSDDAETDGDGDDGALEEFISVRAVHGQAKHVPSVFDVTVPFPLVSNRSLVSGFMNAAT